MKNNGKKLWFRSKITKIVLTAIIAFAGGYVFNSLLQPSPADGEHKHPGEDEVAQEQTVWTCPMHPNIRMPEFGKCPICFMDLVPSSSSDSDIGERQISFSEAAIKLMEVETTAVERKFVTAEIRMVGKVDYDETRVKHITAWVPGRIDRLYVDFTGVNVKKGDHMALSLIHI